MDFENLAQLPEYRSMPFLDFEARDDGWGFEGLASPYGEPANIGDFTEEFKHGAYRKVLATGDNTRLAYDHSPSHVPVLATTKGGTLQIRDDAKGLHVQASIAKHYMGEAARELINRGDIKGMSPGFVVGRGNSDVVTRDNKPHRVIHNLKRLIEISLTPDPAYAGSTAEMRSMWASQMAGSLNDMQHALLGGVVQLESRAVVDDVTEDTVTPEAPEGSGASERDTDAKVCETCGKSPQGDDPCTCSTDEAPEEQRAGVSLVEAAARRRRLRMMGLTLPAGMRDVA